MPLCWFCPQNKKKEKKKGGGLEDKIQGSKLTVASSKFALENHIKKMLPGNSVMNNFLAEQADFHCNNTSIYKTKKNSIWSKVLSV